MPILFSGAIDGHGSGELERAKAPRIGVLKDQSGWLTISMHFPKPKPISLLSFAALALIEVV
ncbi:MAG: hypothetical protein HY765_02900 [Rhodomicrobium sp.]|nr:hypothetical protein [Rhodomicrobium sp.]